MLYINPTNERQIYQMCLMRRNPRDIGGLNVLRHRALSVSAPRGGEPSRVQANKKSTLIQSYCILTLSPELNQQSYSASKFNFPPT